MTQQFEISKKDSLGGLRLENTQLSQWQCTDASIKNLDLWNAPQLTKLDLSLCLPGMHLMLVNCPKITEIILPAGAPCYLHLDSPTSPNLTIQGSIAAFDACWPSQQFRVEGPVPLPLRKTARLFINEATVKELLKEYQQGKAQALEDLRPLVVQMVEPVQVPRALKLLNDLLQAGADPEWVWQTRQELSARHLRGRRKANQRNLLLSEQQLQYALKQWRWNLPTDLNENAWLDDWRIWVACLKNPKAQAYAKVMAKRLIEAEIQAKKA